jgi:AraC family transcriptional activator of pobA
MANKTLPVYSIDKFESTHEAHDFYANTFAKHLKHHHFVKSAHKHDFYLTVLFTQGTGTHEVDFVEYKVRPGAVFFLKPGQMHNWVFSNDIDGYIFFHTRDFYDLRYQYRHIKDFPFFSSLYNSPVVFTNAVVMKRIVPVFHEIVDEYKGARLMRSSRLCSLADLLYIELARLYMPGEETQGSNSGYMQKFRRLEELIDLHFKEIKSPLEYAAMMSMTVKHLNRICKTTVNRTLSEIIMDRVVLEAKRMLVQPDRTVVEVAGELGMFDQSYFTRVFRKTTGETPTQFAAKHRGAGL